MTTLPKTQQQMVLILIYVYVFRSVSSAGLIILPENVPPLQKDVLKACMLIKQIINACNPCNVKDLLTQ